ncbi:MAG: N-acetylmuramoyl-L-alanine amidase, partial [Gammaproteobacteria bacterium]|nr:N-acetylmuramoyl-L-alanine amidase [Gammaproteobacteria bacterium]MDE0442880.1 N-acetylmuramoyl-L-alanine amidase [Gammaproteobacteria bacterium]
METKTGKSSAAQGRRGGIKFVLLHHGGCDSGGFHYRIDANGRVDAELDESERGQHPRSIGIVVEGDFDAEAPNDVQLAALRRLLLKLKLRYPAAELGAHRQVRGGVETTCPGRRFPMKALAEWSRTGLLDERDEVLRRDFEAQYSKI